LLMPVKAIGDAALEVRLTPEDLAQIDRILPPGRVAGTRYPESRMQFVNR